MRYVSWLPAVILLFSCSTKAPQCRGVQSNRCLQVATFNLEFFPDGREGRLSQRAREYKKNRIADLIQSNGLDVIALQEIDGAPEKMIAFVRDFLWGEFDFVLAQSGPDDQKVAVLFRKSLVEQVGEPRELTAQNSGGAIRSQKPHWSGRNRLPLEVTLRARTTGLEFRLVALHLKSGAKPADCDTRAEQVADLAGYLKNISGSYILAGDFNDKLPGNGICVGRDTLLPLENLATLKFLTEPGKGIPQNSVTFILEPYRSVIDHLAVTESLYPRVVRLGQWQAEVLAHENERISDHHPVVFWLRLVDEPVN